jgi:hypothetical protein
VVFRSRCAPDTYAGANVPLIEAQADIALAQALGGGLVAGVLLSPRARRFARREAVADRPGSRLRSAEIRMLSSGGKTTQLGDALAHYGRIFKTLHVLVYVHDETYRRQIKGIRQRDRCVDLYRCSSGRRATVH